MAKMIKAIVGFGPGIFAIGYTIGIGSVTSMIVAGSTFGMLLLWVLLLTCLFSGALIHAYRNFAPVTGETALQAFNNYLPYGKLIGILIIIIINNKRLMGAHAAGYRLNALLGLAFLFSVMISYNGILAVKTQ
jgi:Mn2+/Fe2+ NRAMP family transporter